LSAKSIEAHTIPVSTFGIATHRDIVRITQR